ncbi:TIGR03943 family putative permease subunit [Butyrivibrio sp. INlla21]|uniref:TIGR03943 family putative permease subunit n=1 Tax=Butyrivibrio sp. INlla21 TaxID=1520811 RepID=UPI0008E35656|nr:GTP-binding protein [Butyrivibrio sp. INlla21]SFU31002.1 TIGR03943 family protein [Butyrivibrio sp. INlla21]
MKPVYIINGFLDSGKTDFFRYTINQPYFRTRGKTLLIVCEEGENEYEEALLKSTNTVIEMIEDEEDFTPDALIALDAKYNPERILIEYNGMWNFKNMRLPIMWKLEQQITVIDASSFELYFSNMKSLLAEQLRNSDLILFNRCDGIEDLASYKRNVKAINQKADIIFEDRNGEVDVTLDEDLPFDLNSDPIELNNYGYGMFYLDGLEHVDRYEGKNVKFKGMVLIPPEFPKGRFVPGRMAMTCCAEDMQFLGFACDYDKTDELQEKDWVLVTAKVVKEFVPEYNGEGPVLKAISVEKTTAPEYPVIDFSNPQQ